MGYLEKNNILARFHQIKYLDSEAKLKNPTLKEWEQNGIAIAVGMLVDELRDEIFQRWINIDSVHTRVRQAFENDTLDSCDHWSRETISECDDGRDEYRFEEFNNEFGITSKMSDIEILTQLEQSLIQHFNMSSTDIKDSIAKNN